MRSAASLSDRTNASPTTVDTGSFRANESPKSNVIVLFTSRQYCSSSGSFVPSRSFNASTCSCGANGPDSCRPMSFGRTFTTTNTNVTISQSVTSDSASRRSRYLVIGAAPPTQVVVSSFGGVWCVPP